MVPRIVPGTDFESIVFVSLLRKKSVFHLPDFSGAFSLQGFFRKLLSRKLKQLPEQSQTVCKLWLSPRSIFWCTTVSNAGDTFCPLVLWCIIQHAENWSRTQKKRKQSLQWLFTFVGILFWMFMANQVCWNMPAVFLIVILNAKIQKSCLYCMWTQCLLMFKPSGTLNNSTVHRERCSFGFYNFFLPV